MTKSAFAWALLAAIVWGCVPIIEKAGLSKASPDLGLLIRSLGVIVGASILLAVKFNALKSELHLLTPKTFTLFILGGFLASIVAQIFFYRALKYGSASKVVPVGAIYPLIAFVLALLFLGEKFTLAKFIGVCLILVGVVLLK